MAEYAKKLHVKKGSTVTDIKLYSTTGEVGSNYVTLKDGSNLMYAKLDVPSSPLASPLNVKKGSTTYKVLKNAIPPYTEVTYTTPGTFTFTVPNGVTKLRVVVIGGAGGCVKNSQTWSTKGTDGETSSFGNLLNATGGKGGNISEDTPPAPLGGSPNGNTGIVRTVQTYSASNFQGTLGFNLDFNGNTSPTGYGVSSGLNVPKIVGGYRVMFSLGGGGGYNTSCVAVVPSNTYQITVGAKGQDVSNESKGTFTPLGTDGAVLIAYGQGVE